MWLVCPGLAGVLGLLKEKGELNANKTLLWGGRNNDKSKNALQVGWHAGIG